MLPRSAVSLPSDVWLPCAAVRPDLADRFFTEFENELKRERAAALGRAGRKVEDRRADCLKIGERLDAADGTAQADNIRRAYRAAYAAYADAHWAFCVQRETIGLFDHTWVDRIYPPPPRR